MAIRIIREEGDEILRKKSREVEVIDEKTHELIKDMIFIIDLYEENVEPYVFINPEIIKTKGEQTVEEGCLSFPNKFAKIVRPKEVVVRALNEKGEKFEIKAKDLFAQAISHETDHLNGELFIDKIIPGTLEILTPEQKD